MEELARRVSGGTPRLGDTRHTVQSASYEYAFIRSD